MDTQGERKEKAVEKQIKGAACPLLLVSVSPHIKSNESVSKIMWTVVGSLMPILLFSVFVFGLQTLFITAISVASCIACEYIVQKALDRPVTIHDGSAAVTGVLLAYVLPSGSPLWLPILGAVMAIFITKHLMGGIGFNFFNPALMGRAFLTATFPVVMTTAWVPVIRDGSILKYIGGQVDAVTMATPLYVTKHYGISPLSEQFGPTAQIYKDFFIGLQPGCIGETSALLILLGGLYLIYRGYITWHIPASCLATVAALTWIFGGEKLFTGDPLMAVLSGGVMLGAFYMATDYTTSPSRNDAKLLFGAGVGILTVLIRLKGGYPEGVCYAILLMNCLTPALDSWFRPTRFAPQKGTAQ